MNALFYNQNGVLWGFLFVLVLFCFDSIICFQYRIYTNLIILLRERKELYTRALWVSLAWQYAGGLPSPLENASVCG